MSRPGFSAGADEAAVSRREEVQRESVIVGARWRAGRHPSTARTV